MSRILETIVALSLLMVSLLVFVPVVSSETEEVRQALEVFMEKLSSGDIKNQVNWGWNSTSDPCNDNWKGVECVGNSIRRILLKNSNLSGILDASLLCVTTSLFVLSLENNNIFGELPEEISNCRRLRHVYMQGNKFSGKLPASLSKLSNLKRVDVSNNRFSGQLPEMEGVTGLLTFRAQLNELSGEIPSFDFGSLEEFNVSYNNFSGQISPGFSIRFNASSFVGNPDLCGVPLPDACLIPPLPPPPPSIQRDPKGSSATKYAIYIGYAILGLLVVFLFALRIVTRNRNKVGQIKERTSSSTSVSLSRSIYSDSSKTRGERSEYSIITSPGSATASPFVILENNHFIGGLSFEELLCAPAELIGRGKHGSTYKVTLSREVCTILAVKRVKDWEISRDEFEKRIQKINQVNHKNVMPVLGYYCSKTEKLLVYEYQQNGNLFNLLRESAKSEVFDWGRRLDMAAGIAEALAFMHERLDKEGIAHGNLKSSNILMLNSIMNNPCITEYGLMVVGNSDQGHSSEAENGNNSDNTSSDRNLNLRTSFKTDVYGYGVILLELLTGKVVQDVGFDLARWVLSVIQEEWTAEVFDNKLIAGGASEDMMVNLLQVALKCVDSFADARPSMREVVMMINSIKEDEDEEDKESSAVY